MTGIRDLFSFCSGRNYSIPRLSSEKCFRWGSVGQLVLHLHLRFRFFFGFPSSCRKHTHETWATQPAHVGSWHRHRTVSASVVQRSRKEVCERAEAASEFKPVP